MNNADELTDANSLELAAAQTLTTGEARELVNQINRGVKEIRALLIRLDEGQGFLALGYASMRECALGEFNQHPSYVFRQLEAAKVDRRLSPAGDTQIPERHARELAALPEDRQAEVYAEAQRRAGDRALTADAIRETAVSLGVGREKWGARAAASNMRDYREALVRFSAVDCALALALCFNAIPPRVLMKAMDQVRQAPQGEKSAMLRDALAGVVPPTEKGSA